MHKCLTVVTGGSGHGHSTEAKLVEHIGRYSMPVYGIGQEGIYSQFCEDFVILC